jgi:general secretion pathway protein G
VLELYKLDKFGYPDSKQGLEVLVGPYLNTLPKDPWGKQYLYLNVAVEKRNISGV